MFAQVAKWGNSQGLRIDKQLLSSIGLKIGDRVEIIKHNNELVLKPQHDINWYLADYERPEGESWEAYDEPKGREIW